MLRAIALAALILACSLPLGGCLGAALIVECLPSLIDTDPYRQLCGPARPKPHDDAGYKAALYYLACPRVGEWVAEEKWPEDCLTLKARMGVK